MTLDRKVALFAELDDSELDKVQAITEERSYHSGDFILRQGNPADAVYVVTQGAVRVTAIMADEDDTVGRDEEVLVRLGPGEFFGELSFVRGSVPAVSVIAEGETRALALPHEALGRLLDSEGALCRKLLFAMMRTMVERLRETDRELVLSRYFIRGR